jgi:signal transduction histidine kinase
MSSQRINTDYRVLVLAVIGKDAELIRKVLEQSGFAVETISSSNEIVRRMEGGAGTAVIAEEALDEHSIERLGRTASAQPPWSDFPLIVLTGGGASTPFTEMAVRSRAPLGNITLLERPVRPATLISAVRTAIRARFRQYEIRNHLEERNRNEAELRRAHEHLESLVEQRTNELRKLSARLLTVQDDERRRIARELHDGMGQYLAAAQINIDLLVRSEGARNSPFLLETRKLIEHAVSDIRTLSYLLHPPLLDEAGFDSAARWYVEGFAKRSGISVRLDLTPQLVRMPSAIELALFRVLQEGLTNVHRHSGSIDVDVTFARDGSAAVLEVRDYGRGLPKNLAERFQTNGTAAGVGLAGIRERIKELNGDFEIISTTSGTLLRATVPLQEEGSASKAVPVRQNPHAAMD